LVVRRVHIPSRPTLARPPFVAPGVSERQSMEIEYRDDRRKARVLIIAGVVLALAAGGAAFFAITQARQEAGSAGAQKIAVVVAVRTIEARQAVSADDVALRDVPLDATNASGVIADPSLAVGRIAAVTILQNQLVTTNMLVSETQGAAFSILGPGETIGPDTEAWRAVSITVPDDLAVGGMLSAGQTVDVFVTAVVSLSDAGGGRYIPDRSTKITYQDVVILSRKDSFYIIRAPVHIAEEILHLQATGAATFAFALRPLQDQRQVDSTALGETTNMIIEKYGMPIPEVLEPGFTAEPTATPAVDESPSDSGSPEPAAAVPAPSAPPVP
jgi:Flp pilus assembly protein CpaB